MISTKSCDSWARLASPQAQPSTPPDLHSDPQLLAREMITEIEHQQRGTLTLPGCPIKLENSPVDITTSPLLGEHNAEVYGEIFGYGPEEIARLKEERVI